jgi:hypothetical protein
MSILHGIGFNHGKRAVTHTIFNFGRKSKEFPVTRYQLPVTGYRFSRRLATGSPVSGNRNPATGDRNPVTILWCLGFISATLLPFHETYTRHIFPFNNPTQCGDYHASEA